MSGAQLQHDVERCRRRLPHSREAGCVGDSRQPGDPSLGAEALRQPGAWDAIPVGAGDAVYVSGYGLVAPESGAVLGAWAAALPAEVLLFVDPGPLISRMYFPSGWTDSGSRTYSSVYPQRRHMTSVRTSGSLVSMAVARRCAISRLAVSRARKRATA